MLKERGGSEKSKRCAAPGVGWVALYVLELGVAACSGRDFEIRFPGIRVTAEEHLTNTNLPIAPPDYFRVKTVHSFAELIGTPFADGVNALCWPRALPGDFGAVVEKLGGGEEIVTIEEEQLAGLEVSATGRTATEILREDLRRLREAERQPVLNCIHGYPRDEGAAPVQTDVFSWHADSAPVEADTWLCTYFGLPSEGLPNEAAQRRVDIPEVRAELLKFLSMEEDDGEFREALREHCFDLHYAPLPHARPYSFGTGNLWRIAVEWPGSRVPPCIHRAPATLPGESPRLLLIC